MTTQSTIRILIIDDDGDEREILGALLGAQGHEITSASSGTEGILLARKLVPDLIILDVMMPELDGFAVCTALRAAEATAEVPIIIATTLDDCQSRLRGLAVGADEFLTCGSWLSCMAVPLTSPVRNATAAPSACICRRTREPFHPAEPLHTCAVALVATAQVCSGGCASPPGVGAGGLRDPVEA